MKVSAIMVARNWGFSVVARLGIPDPNDMGIQSRKKRKSVCKP